ncbi:MAG: endonuclease/exonuclease/phosphatase family protein [Chloroflexi bacterium]|nr:endonuclease/exonuclease/phosphatase family protein [Chloroflexota bacterium]MDA1146151.1 endonuclease/exonuclease/phosphatase family protein [Chloroflexota bacterium]
MEVRWIVDNALNFAPHVAVLALAVVAYSVFGRHWSLAIVSMVVVVFAGAYIARSDALLARAHDCPATPRLRIATFNVQAGAADFDAFAQLVEEQDVQIVVLEEMTFNASFYASALYERYPYRVASSPRWIEVLSTVPLDSVGSFNVFGQSEARRIWRATLTEPFQTDLYFFHAMTSRSAFLHNIRSDQYAVLEEVLDQSPGPAIVVGDMNATVLDPSFGALLRSTGLRTGVDGRRDAASWPSGLGWLGLRIDHVLQRGFEVCDASRGSSFGSDHRPVIVELAETPPA